MNIPNFSIRLLTLLSYFLPFVFFLSTCTSELTSKDAYNRADALSNEHEKIEKELSDLDLLLKKIDSKNAADVTSELSNKINSSFSSSDNVDHLKMDVQYRLLMPTDYSLSAIGSIWFHKNIIGKIAISVSLALSLIVLIFYRVLEKRKIAFQTIAADVVVLVIFIADNFLSNVATLFGTWTLLFLLLVQLTTEWRKTKTANH